MWKSVRKEDERPVTPPSPPATSAYVPPAVPPKEVKPFMETPKISDSYRADVAHIGKSVLVKGELSGSEDLYLDGEVEGSIDLKGHSLTIGPNGRVRANVNARDVVVHGKVEGNLRAADRVELKKSAILMGDIFTQRIVIEDGAFFKGGIDIQKAEKNEPKSAAAAASVASPAISHTPAPSASPAVSSVAAAPHAALLEPKKF